MSIPKLQITMMLTRTFANLAICIGCIGLAGYLLQHEWMLTWGKSVSMALPTTVAIIANGIAIKIICTTIERVAEEFNNVIRK
jgi:hypothetical protein